MELFEQNVIMFTFEHIFFFFFADRYVADLLNYDLKCTWWPNRFCCSISFSDPFAAVQWQKT